MLVGGNLKTLMVNTVHQKALSYGGNYPEGSVIALEMQEVLVGVIEDYILNNMKFAGVYSGMIPGSPPVVDPLSGNYVIEPLAIPGLSPSAMLGSVGGGIQAWFSLFINLVKTMILKPNLPQLTLSPLPPLVGCVPCVLSLTNPNDFDTIYMDLANALVNSLNSTVVSGVVFPAVSTAGGQGMMALATII